MGQNPARRVDGISRFDAEQDEVGAGDGGRIGGSLQRYAAVKMHTIEIQPIAPDGVHMGGASHECDGHAGTRQHAAEVASDGARAEYGNSRRVFHWSDRAATGRNGILR